MRPAPGKRSGSPSTGLSTTIGDNVSNQFNAAGTELTAWALLFYTIGLPWFATSKILVPAFYSTQDMRTPVKIAAGVMFLNIILNLLLLKPLLNGGPAFATAAHEQVDCDARAADRGHGKALGRRTLPEQQQTRDDDGEAFR